MYFFVNRGSWNSYFLSMETYVYFLLPPILNMENIQILITPQRFLGVVFFVCLPIVFRKIHFQDFHDHHLSPFLRSPTLKRNNKKIILCRSSIVLWIVLCLKLKTTIVSVITVFEAKWTQHEKQQNLCSMGEQFYLVIGILKSTKIRSCSSIIS